MHLPQINSMHEKQSLLFRNVFPKLVTQIETMTSVRFSKQEQQIHNKRVPSEAVPKAVSGSLANRQNHLFGPGPKRVKETYNLRAEVGL